MEEKKPTERPNTQDDIAQKRAFLQQASAMNERQKLMEHELENKAHDTEFAQNLEENGQLTLQVIGTNEIKKAIHLSVDKSPFD